MKNSPSISTRPLILLARSSVLMAGILAQSLAVAAPGDHTGSERRVRATHTGDAKTARTVSSGSSQPVSSVAGNVGKVKDAKESVAENSSTAAPQQGVQQAPKIWLDVPKRLATTFKVNAGGPATGSS